MSSAPQSVPARLAPELARTLAGRRFGLLGFDKEETNRIATLLERVHAVSARFEESWIGKSVYLGDALLIKMVAVRPEPLRAAALSPVPVLIVGGGDAVLEGMAAAYAWPREILLEPWSESELLVRLFRVVEARLEAVQAGSRTRPLVLIADDDPAWNALVESTVSTHSLACRTVTDGLRALRMARQLRPDLMVLDIQMPGMDGFEVLETMRRDPILETMPVAMLTACVDAAEVNRASALRADDYIAKPVSPTVLLNRIRKLLNAAGPPEAAAAGPAQNEPAEDRPEKQPSLDELRAMYLNNRVRELASLASALQRSDFEALARAGHNLKGTGGAYGFAELSEIGKDLEVAAKAQNAPEIQVLLGKTESYLKHSNAVPGET